MSIQERVDELKEDFALFDDSDDKLEYIFDLGKSHKGLEEAEKTDENYINGCSSDAWLVAECKDGVLYLRGEGTSQMAKGMMEMLLSIFSGRSADEILSFDPSKLNELGIIELLSPVRQQSLEAFLNKVYAYAKGC